MEYKTVIVERKGQTGWITLNRHDQLNTFTTQLAEELNAALYEMEKDPGIRVVVIKGAGRGFCAGIDLKEFQGKSIVEVRRLVKLMDQHNITIARMTKPVIAAVHGVAVANGCGLAAACDLTVAAEHSRFGTTAINVGLFCFGPAAPVSRSLGRKRALEMLLTGEIIDATRAEQMGLVNKVVPREKLEEAAAELAERLAAKSPLALQMGKSAYYRMADMSYEDALSYLGEIFVILSSTEDGAEGVDAFLNKREPHYKGQ